MASAIDRGNGTFQARIYLGIDDHKRKRFVYKTFRLDTKTKTGKNKTAGSLQDEANAYASKLEAEIKTESSLIVGHSLTFGDLYNRWLSGWYNSPSEKPSKALRKSYKDNLEWYVLPELRNRKLRDIKKTTLMKLYTKLSQEIVKEGQKAPLKKSSISKVHQAIRSVYTYGEDADLIDKNPAQNIRLSNIFNEEPAQSQADCFTFEQAERFIEFVNSPFVREKPSVIRIVGEEEQTVNSYMAKIEQHRIWDSLFRLAINEGLRKGEIVALTWNDIHFNSIKDNSGKPYSQIVINKTISRDENNKQYVKAGAKTINGNRTKTIMTETAEALKKLYEAVEGLNEDLKKMGIGFEDLGALPVFAQDKLLYDRIDISTPSHKFKDILKYYNQSHEAEPLPDIHFHSLRKTSITFETHAGIDRGIRRKRHGHADKDITDYYLQLTPEIDLDATKQKEAFYQRKRNELEG